MNLRNWVYAEQWYALYKEDKEYHRKLWELKESRPDIWPKLSEWLDGL